MHKATLLAGLVLAMVSATALPAAALTCTNTGPTSAYCTIDTIPANTGTLSFTMTYSYTSCTNLHGAPAEDISWYFSGFSYASPTDEIYPLSGTVTWGPSPGYGAAQGGTCGWPAAAVYHNFTADGQQLEFEYYPEQSILTATFE